jgi:hypothetical protein
MWHECQQTLQHAYREGVVGFLPDAEIAMADPVPGTGIFQLVGTPLARSVYCISDLGELMPHQDSVIYVNSRRAQHAAEVLSLGLEDDSGSEEALYFGYASSPPKSPSGPGGNNGTEP